MNAALGGRQPPEWIVLSPSIEDVYDRLAAKLSNSCAEGAVEVAKDKLFDIGKKIAESLQDVLHLPPRVSIENLFNGNIRHQSNFTRDVIDELAVSSLWNSLYGRRTNSPQIEFEVSNFSQIKAYRYVDLLLFSAGGRFRNFVSIDRPKRFERDEEGRHLQSALRSEHMQDSDAESGYVGNLLIYHIWYLNAGDEAFLLEKIRILEVLRRCGREPGSLRRKSQPARWIIEQFAENGWPVSPVFQQSLFLVVREGMLELSDATHHERYRLLPLGTVAVTQLVSKFGYLENVFYGTNLPKWIMNEAADIERSSSVARWTTAALFQVWLLLRLRHAEAIPAFAGQKTEMFIFERMRAGVAVGVAKIAEAESFRRAASAANELIQQYRRRAGLSSRASAA